MVFDNEDFIEEKKAGLINILINYCEKYKYVHWKNIYLIVNRFVLQLEMFTVHLKNI